MPSRPSPIHGRRALRPRKKKASSSDNTESDNDVSDNDDNINNIGKDEPDSGKNKISRSSPNKQKQIKKSSSSPNKQEKQVMTKKMAEVGVETKKEPACLPPNSKTTKKTPDPKQLKSLPSTCMTCVGIVLAILAIYIYALQTDSKPVPPKFRKEVFLAKLAGMKGTFPSQSERFWNVIGAAPMSHLTSSKEPERPVVIMLVAQPSTGPTTACIAKHLGKLYTQALGGLEYTVKPVHVNGSDFIGHNADETKVKLDSELANGFDSSSLAAIIDGFDKLPACSILLFHSYCENDNAQYKDVAIVLTVELEEPVDIETSSFKDIDSHVDRHLTKYWSMCPDLQRDKKDAMLSRVANNIALVTEEQHLATCSM